MELTTKELLTLLETAIKLKATPGAMPAISPEQLQSLIEEVIVNRTKSKWATNSGIAINNSNLHTTLR